MANGWTPERRARQAALIKTWRPWEKSTGPRTQGGKAVVAGNAYKGGHRQKLRTFQKVMNHELKAMRELRDALT